MRLRKWQADFVQKTINAFKQGQRIYFLSAAPGGGKSVACAELGARMHDEEMVDLDRKSVV